MTEREALKLALEALQDYVDEYGPWSDDSGAQYVLRVGKEALAQQEERNFCPRCGKRLGQNDWDIHTCTPPQLKEQEPVITVRIWRDENHDQNAEFKNWHTLPDGEHILYTKEQL